MVMKRSYVLAVALVCLLTGEVISHLSTRCTEAQSGPIGRYQPFKGTYIKAGKEFEHLFQIATATGETDEYTPKICLAGQTSALPPPALPKPTGPHAVGTAIFHLSDTSRKDNLNSFPSGSRELTIQVWYRGKASKRVSALTYIPDPALLAAMKKAGYNDLSPEVLDSWSRVQTHSVRDAPIVTSPRRLPLLFFSHRFGMSRSNYTSIIEDLASHSYIVVAIDGNNILG
jgi:hypothetical protein